MTNRSNHFKFIIAVAFLLTVSDVAAHAAAFMDTYIPPEHAYARDLRQRIRASGKTNLNRAPLYQLEALPGFDEDIALKIMRSRPMADFQDLYRIPGLEKKSVQRLIQLIQPRVIFK